MDIWEIEKVMGFKKILSEHHTGGYFYRGVFSTGRFEALDDYNRGVLEVSVGQLKASAFKNNKISIRTIDDGVWQGFSENELSAEQIDSIVKEIERKWCKKLPTEKELNELLNLYGIHGIYTG